MFALCVFGEVLHFLGEVRILLRPFNLTLVLRTICHQHTNSQKPPRGLRPQTVSGASESINKTQREREYDRRSCCKHELTFKGNIHMTQQRWHIHFPRKARCYVQKGGLHDKLLQWQQQGPELPCTRHGLKLQFSWQRS